MNRDGMVYGMPDAEYRAGDEFSSTGMKWILRSPAHYAERIAHRIEKPEFDFGHAVHSAVLGTGMEYVRIPDDVLASNGATSTKAAKDFMEATRAEGKVPLKGDVIDRVDAVAGAVLAHPKAARLLTAAGNAEVSAFVTDPETGVRLRGRIDWLTLDLLPGDLKTTTDVRRHKVRRVIEDFGYDVQAATYRHVLRLATGREPAPMRLVFVETEPPHEVRVVSLADEAWTVGGEAKMRRALERYAECVASGRWPGDDDGDDEPEALTPRPYYLDDALGIEPDDLEVTF